jgi:hypothetical protein
MVRPSRALISSVLSFAATVLTVALAVFGYMVLVGLGVL